MIIPSRFAADSIEAGARVPVCVKNVNLCASSKIGLQNEAGLSNELFKCRNKKKREQSFLEQKHSEIKKKRQKEFASEEKETTRKETPQTEQTKHSSCVRACVCVQPFALYVSVCNDDDRCLTVISHRQTSLILARPAVCVCVGPTARKSCGGSKEDKVEPSRLRRTTAAGALRATWREKIPDYGDS